VERRLRRLTDETEIVEIDSGKVTGTFPGRALAHVEAWRELHKSEILEDWRLASERKPMKWRKPTATMEDNRRLLDNRSKLL
jgi:hypothetical protein